jgi:hypothetical protein
MITQLRDHGPRTRTTGEQFVDVAIRRFWAKGYGATSIADILHVATDYTYGCRIGSLALELHEPDPAVRKPLAANFSAWTGAIAECLKEAGPRLPCGTKVRELASVILTTMEGGVMQARTHRSTVTYDAAMNQLRGYLSHLEAAASANPRKAS